MTCVSGHLTGLDIPPSHKNWDFPPPESLFFEAPVITTIDDVITLFSCDLPN